jgi:two-component system sensor histidine kinase KdpD
VRRPSTARGLAVAVASVALTTAVIYPLAEIVPVVSTGVVYMLAVLLVSSYWGLWLGLFTALLSAAAWNFFHIPPTGEFTIDEGENWVALAVFMVAALVTSTLAGAARSRAEDAEQGRREADLTAEMARLLLRGGSGEEQLRAVAQRIA